MPSSTSPKPIVWISGASTGIGHALAQYFSRTDCQLIISSRRTELMADIPDAEILSLDVTDRSEWEKCTKLVENKFGHIDQFIYNSGNCEYYDVQNLEPELFERLMAVNYQGLVNGVAAVLPLLRKSSHPHLIGMSSSVSWLALPRAAAYGASKAAASYFLESLRMDLKPENIPVSIIRPGFVKTPLTDRNDFPMPMLVTAEKAAEAIYRGIQKKQYEIHFPKPFTWTLRLLALLPPRLRSFITSKFDKS